MLPTQALLRRLAIWQKFIGGDNTQPLFSFCPPAGNPKAVFSDGDGTSNWVVGGVSYLYSTSILTFNKGF
jgi:hypothetical protein